MNIHELNMLTNIEVNAGHDQAQVVCVEEDCEVRMVHGAMTHMMPATRDERGQSANAIPDYP